MNEAEITTQALVAREEHQLALLERAKHALAEARSIEEVLEIRDQARALKAYAQKKRVGGEIVRLGNELILRADRRLGEYTRTMETAPGTRTDRAGPGSLRDPGSSPVKKQALKAAGLTRKDAHVCESIAAIPEQQFEAELKEPGATVKRLARIGREQKTKRPRPKPQPGPIPAGHQVSDRILEQRALRFQVRVEKLAKQYVEGWPAGRPTALLAKALQNVAEAIASGLSDS